MPGLLVVLVSPSALRALHWQLQTHLQLLLLLLQLSLLLVACWLVCWPSLAPQTGLHLTKDQSLDIEAGAAISRVVAAAHMIPRWVTNSLKY
jgi:hypothetical protein